MPSYYDILGVTGDTDEKGIRQAYRKLARQWHPDVNPGDSEAEAKFKRINEAYEVLSDPEKRVKYDKYGDDWKHADELDKARASQEGATSLTGSPALLTSTVRWEASPAVRSTIYCRASDAEGPGRSASGTT